MATATNTTETNPLRSWRLERGLSLHEVAAAIGVEVNQVRVWESGRMRPNIVNQVRLARLLGITLVELQEMWS